MVGKIIIEGVLLGALLVLLCAVGIRKGAVTMVFLYHGDVQDRCVQNGLITRERIWQNRKMESVFAKFHPTDSRIFKREGVIIVNNICDLTAICTGSQ